MENANKPSKSRRYWWPLRLLVFGILIPPVIGTAMAIMSRRPQCPTDYTQAQIDAGSCIIGADMSGLYIILALPFMLASILAAGVWALVIWRRSR